MPERYPDDVLRRLQDVELEILAAVDEVCRRNDITYFINGGTLLGAVRHGGFIPWDDDIDIGILHEDYLRFVEVAQRDLPDGYVLHTPQNTPEQLVFCAKVVKAGTRFIDSEALESGYEQGIFVDVFDFREFDADRRRRSRQARDSVLWQRMSYLTKISQPHVPRGTRFKPLVRLALRASHAIVSRLFSRETILENFERAWEGTDPGGLWIDAPFGYRTPYPTKMLLPTRPMEFCGREFMGPADPEGFLRTLYGDTYMELPPEEERHNHTPEILDFGDGTNVMGGGVA